MGELVLIHPSIKILTKYFTSLVLDTMTLIPSAIQLAIQFIINS